VRRLKKFAVLIVSALVVAIAATGPVAAKKKKSPPCVKAHRLKAIDVLMTPDPLGRNEPVRFWRVQVEVDGTGECETVIALRDSTANRFVGPQVTRIMKPGLNTLRFESAAPYRFQRNSHCFSVSVGNAQANQTLKAERRFCVRQLKDNRWTLRAREEWQKDR
jgi:hypothetical protein